MGWSSTDDPRRPGTADRDNNLGRRRLGGFTTIELLIVLAIIGILAAIVALNLRPLSNHAENGANAIAAGLKQARARAMSTTSAYRLVFASPTRIEASYANSCSATAWTAEPAFDIAVEDSAWVEIDGAGDDAAGVVVACYNSRGFADASTRLSVQDERGRSRTLEIFVGGGVVVE